MLGSTAELDEYRQTNANLASKLGQLTRKAAQYQHLYETMKRNATLEQIQHTASQVIGPNIEAATSAGAMPVDQHLGHQYIYPRGTIVSPRYADAQLTQQRSFDAHISPRVDSAAHGGRNASYGGTYPGVQPRRSASDARNIPRREYPSFGWWLCASNKYLADGHQTPRTRERHKASATTGVGLSSVQGVIAGAPLGTPRGTPRVSTDSIGRIVDPRQLLKAPVRFPGVGLGPGVGFSRHGVNGAGSGSYHSSARFEGYVRSHVIRRHNANVPEWEA